MGNADKSIRINFESIDVVDFLEELGIRNVRDEGLEVFYSCPFPGHSHGDANPSASMRQGSTVAYCFGCGWSGNALKFLADYEGVSPLKAAEWIRQRFGNDFQEPEGSFLEEFDTILAETHKREDTTPGVLDEYECSRREVDWTLAAKSADTPYPMKYMIERGFDPGVLSKFKIGWDAISQRIAIPYRDADGRLLGFKGRAYLDEQIPRYCVLGGPEYGFDPVNVSYVLWGLPEALRGERYFVTNQAILVEGELNALAMHQYGYNNTIGISGKYLSDKQLDLIKNYFSSVVVIMDDMKDQIAAAEKIEPYMPVDIVPEHDTDPADGGRDYVTDLYLQRKNLLAASLPTD